MRRMVLSWVLVVVCLACQAKRPDSDPETYKENNVLWAHGSVLLEEVGAKAEIVFDKLENDQALDSGDIEYTVWGKEKNALDQQKFQLLYVDYHPAKDRLLSFVYEIVLQKDRRYGNRHNLFAKLLKASISYHDRQDVYLGSVELGSSGESIVKLAQGVKISKVTSGYGKGNWALHYAESEAQDRRGWDVKCEQTRDPENADDQSGQCKPIISKFDLCAGNPTSESCHPEPPGDHPNTIVQIDSENAAQAKWSDRVYILPAEEKKLKALVVFDESVENLEANNAKCNGEGLVVVAATVGGQLNRQCKIEAGSVSELIDGKITCALQVELADSRSYLERVCNVYVKQRYREQPAVEFQVLKAP